MPSLSVSTPQSGDCFFFICWLFLAGCSCLCDQTFRAALMSTARYQKSHLRAPRDSACERGQSKNTEKWVAWAKVEPLPFLWHQIIIGGRRFQKWWTASFRPILNPLTSRHILKQSVFTSEPLMCMEHYIIHSPNYFKSYSKLSERKMLGI